MKKQSMHKDLKARMLEWSGMARELGLTPEQAQVQFAQLFQCDVYTARTLSSKDAKSLMDRIAL